MNLKIFCVSKNIKTEDKESKTSFPHAADALSAILKYPLEKLVDREKIKGLENDIAKVNKNITKFGNVPDSVTTQEKEAFVYAASTLSILYTRPNPNCTADMMGNTTSFYIKTNVTQTTDICGYKVTNTLTIINTLPIFKNSTFIPPLPIIFGDNICRISPEH